LLGGYILRVGQLREVLVHNLLPGSLVLALEHILKLHKGVREVEIDFLGPFFKVGDQFVDCEVNAKFSTILVDFGLDFSYENCCSATYKSWATGSSCPMSFLRQSGAVPHK
jgi:hypothetical protein